MNLLPYVAGLLILLALSIQPLLSGLLVAKKIHSSYQGHMNASRNALSLQEKNRYKRIPVEEKPKPQEKKEKKTIRVQQQLVNIFPLLAQGKEERPLLYSFFTHLIVHLYEKEPFFPEKNKKKMAELLVDNLIECSRKQKETLHLEKLELKNNELQLFLYNILKGTRPYGDKKDLSSKEDEGRPSLYEYIYSSPDPKEDRIPILFADFHLLTALFNDQVAHRILQYQKETKSFISKPILEKIFQETHFSPHESLWKSLDFSQAKSNLAIERISSEDKKTHIFLTRKNYSTKEVAKGQDLSISVEKQ
jgi:hypothetical protein